MMDFFYKTICLAVVMMLAQAGKLNAQFYYPSKYQIGAQVGGMISRTSLTFNKFGAYNQMHPSIEIFAERKLFKPISIRASLLVGQIGSDDSKANDKNYPWLPLRAFKYTTTMAELSALLVWNFVGEKYDMYDHSHSNRFSPYIFVGGGLSFVSIKRDWSGIDAAAFAGSTVLSGLALDTTHALPKTVPVIPMGGGLKYAVTPQWTIMGEINFRYTFERLLDGFSYSTPRSQSKDFYYGLSIGVAYRPAARDFRNDCPKSVL